MISLSCADPEGEGAGGPGHLETSQKYRVSYKYWSGTPEYFTKLPSQHSMSDHHWPASGADDGPLLVAFGASLPLSPKRLTKRTKKKRCQSWTSYDKNFWIRVCL